MSQAQSNNSIIMMFDTDRVRPLPGQPRKRFAGIQELADSILEIGQVTPGIVTAVTDDPDFDVQLVDGERRYRACKSIGAKFRAEVRSSDQLAAGDMFTASVAANFNKQEHDVIEIAEALQKMVNSGKSVVQIEKIVGKSNAWIYQHLNLLKLHPKVQQLMEPSDNGSRISFMTAQTLVALKPADQVAIANELVASNLTLAACRRRVLKFREEKGVPVESRGQRATVNTIRKIASDAMDRLGVFEDMKPAELNRIIDSMSEEDMEALHEKLEDVSMSFSAIATTIKQRMAK